MTYDFLERNNGMCKVIAIVNQKGGVAKTTTTVNLGIGLVNEGKRVLLIDSDSQGSLSSCLGVAEPDELDVTLPTIMSKIMNDEEFDNTWGVLKHEEGISFLPCNIELSGLEVSMVSMMRREFILSEYVEKVRDLYDFILIDCNSSLGMMTMNALTTADSIIIPIQAAYLSVKGLQQLITTISKTKKYLKFRMVMVIMMMKENSEDMDIFLIAGSEWLWKEVNVQCLIHILLVEFHFL